MAIISKGSNPGPLRSIEVVAAHVRDVTRALNNQSFEPVAAAVDICNQVRLSGGCLYICGNGGSAATALHAACDLTKLAHVAGGMRLRVATLVDNPAIMTAYANDHGYEDIFLRQIEGVISARDVLIGISVSGSSENVIRAIRFANDVGARTIGMSGSGSQQMRSLVTLAIVVAAGTMQAVEDAHMVLLHSVSMALLDRQLAESR